MDIHKPKPWHGLREFLKEYLIIVVGVLTALGAEQVAEMLHWAHKIDEAEHAMRLELATDDGPQGFARVITAACFDTQLDTLEKLASAGADRQTFRKFAIDYIPPGRTWDALAWQAAIASDVGTHMGAEKQSRWATAYYQMPILGRQGDAEQDALGALSALRDAPGPLTAAEADRAIALIAHLRGLNVGMAWGGKSLMDAMKHAGVTVSEADKADILQQARRRFGSCAKEPADTPASNPARDSKSQFPTLKNIRDLVGVRDGL